MSESFINFIDNITGLIRIERFINTDLKCCSQDLLKYNTWFF